MKTIKKMMWAAISLAGTLLFAAVATAAEEAAHGGGHGEITFMGDWFPRLVNFGILAVVLVYFLRKPTRDFFKNRTAEIEKSVRESKEARERAVAALADMERKMKEMQAETARMVSEAQTRGEKDKQALAEEGRKLAEDIQAQVKIGVDIEVQKAKAELALEAAALAVDVAEDKIRKQIGAQDHERIVKDYISKVGGRG